MIRWSAGLLFACAACALVACSDSGHPLDFSLFPVCNDFGVGCLSTPESGGQPLVAARSTCDTNLTSYCAATAAAPALACIGATAPSASTDVTLTGFVHVYGTGPDTVSHTSPISSIATVQVFRADALAMNEDPAVTTPLATTLVPALPDGTPFDTTDRRACDTDPRVGCSIPATTCGACNDGLQGRKDDHKYCRATGTSPAVCASRARWEDRYTIAGVPTNTQLVVRVTGPNNLQQDPWANTITANLVLLTTDRACSGPGDSACYVAGTATYQLDATVMSTSDFQSIPITAGLGGGIQKGHGAILGEVHDCDDVRLGNVIVGTQPAAPRFTYYDGDPLDPMPDVARFTAGTDRLGRFAALDFAPGPVDIETVGLLTATGAPRSFGRFAAVAYANTITLLTVNGGRPQ